VQYDFDRKIERRGTNCLKWDHADWFFGTNDLLPMWVADMDFEAPEPVLEAIRERAGHGAFGYTVKPESYHEALVEWMKKRHRWEGHQNQVILT